MRLGAPEADGRVVGARGEQLARKLLLTGCYFKELLMEVNLVFS